MASLQLAEWTAYWRNELLSAPCPPFYHGHVHDFVHPQCSWFTYSLPTGCREPGFNNGRPIHRLAGLTYFGFVWEGIMYSTLEEQIQVAMQHPAVTDSGFHITETQLGERANDELRDVMCADKKGKASRDSLVTTPYSNHQLPALRILQLLRRPSCVLSPGASRGCDAQQWFTEVR